MVFVMMIDTGFFADEGICFRIERKFSKFKHNFSFIIIFIHIIATKK